MKFICQLILFSAFIACSTTVAAQSEFYKKYTTTTEISGRSLVQLPDSGYFTGGSFAYVATNGYDRTFTRFDKYGNVLWDKKASVSSSDEYSSFVLNTSVNHLVIAGGVFGSYFSVTHLNPNGTLISQRRFTYTSINGAGNQIMIAEAPDKKLYISQKEHLVKTDSAGNVIWQKRLLLPDIDVYGIHPISASRIILTGQTWGGVEADSKTDLVEVCIDSAGAIVWSKVFGTAENELVRSSIYIDGKLLLFGSVDNALVSTPPAGNSFIFCTDTTGQQLWCKLTPNRHPSQAPVLLTDGTIATLSVISSGMPTGDSLEIQRISTNGEFINGSRIPIPHTSIGSYTATNDGGLYVQFYFYTAGNPTRHGLKIGPNLQPDCLPGRAIAPYTSSQMLLPEYPALRLKIGYVAETAVAQTPVIVNIGTTTTPICTGTCTTFAAFTPDQNRICAGSTVHFTNNSIQMDSCQWWVDTVLVSQDTVFSHTFTGGGLYTIKLIVFGTGCTDSTSSQVWVETPLPAPVFTVASQQRKAWMNPVLSGTTQVSWNFGDGTPQLYAFDSVVHNYKKNGVYTVCLEEKNTCGTVSSCQQINLYPDSSYRFDTFYDGVYNFDHPGMVAITNQALANGDYLLGGIFDFGFDKAMLLRTDGRGTPKRSQIFVPAQNNFKLNRISESYNGTILIGATNGDNPYLGIADSSGTFVNFMRPTAANAFALSSTPVELPDGTIIFSGNYGTQTFIMKTTPTLGVYWFKRHSAIRTVMETVADGNDFILVGTEFSNTSVAIMKLNANGDFIYAKQLDLPGACIAKDILRLADGKFIVCGSESSSSKAFMLKMDGNANIEWIKSYSTLVLGIGSPGLGVSEDPEGNLYLTSGSVIIKTNNSGTPFWGWRADVTMEDQCSTHDGGVHVLGTGVNSTTLQYRIGSNKIDASGTAPGCSGALGGAVEEVPLYTMTDIVNFTTSTIPFFTYSYYVGNNNVTETVNCIAAAPFLSAGFSYSGTCAGLPVTFTDESQGDVTSWEWSFPGATPAVSTQQNPVVSYSTPGTYTATLTIQGTGGPVTVSQTITVTTAASASAGNDQTICAGDTVTLTGTGNGTLHWETSSSLGNPANGSTTAFPASTQQYVLVAETGCVMTDTVTVFVYQSTHITETVDLCPGETYAFQGNTYSATGTYTAGFTTIHGCDSTFTLHLTMHTAGTYEFSASTCNGTPYVYGGNQYTAAGTYTVHIPTAYGCDSVVTLHLNVLPSQAAPAYQTVTLCQGEVYQLGGTSYSQAGNYVASVPMANGCDSLIQLTVIVANPETVTLDEWICPGSSYVLDGISYTTAGTYFAYFQTVNGCDSTVILHLTITPPSASQLNVTICQGADYTFNGDTYTTSGIYSTELQTANGCDSIATLVLTVDPPLTSSFNVAICNGESYLFNGIYHTVSGTYSMTLASAAGCDSIVTLFLNVAVPVVSVTQTNQLTLTATSAATVFSWLDCGANYSPTGVTSAVFTAVTNGEYAVTATVNGCTDTSACFVISSVGVSEEQAAPWLVYPVPSDDLVYFEVPENSIGSQYVLFDNAGKMVLTGTISTTRTIISLASLATGLYQLQLEGQQLRSVVIRE